MINADRKDGFLAKRDSFEGIGITRAKRKLNSLARGNPAARAVKLALEIETKSKAAFLAPIPGRFELYAYKDRLVHELITLSEQEGWLWGTIPSRHDGFAYACFEINGWDQVSWFIRMRSSRKYRDYGKAWDCKADNIDRLESAAEELLYGKGYVRQQQEELFDTSSFRYFLAS